MVRHFKVLSPFVSSRRMFSNMNIEKLHELALKKDLKQLEIEILEMGKQMKIKNVGGKSLMSLANMAAKICVKKREFGLIYEILDCLQNKSETSSSQRDQNSIMKVGILNIIDECLTNESDLEEAIKAHSRLKSIGGKLDVNGSERLFRRLISDCRISHCFDISKEYPITESLLVMFAEPFIMSGRFNDF